MQNRYTRFVPHEDNVEEIISADHLNDLQDQTETNQQELYRQDDTDFLDRALFILENHTIVNSLYIDLAGDITKVDLEASAGIVFSSDERGFSLEEDINEAVLYMKTHQNVNNTNVSDVVFMANAVIPDGTRVTYEVSNNDLNYYPIVPSEANVFSIPTMGSKLSVRVRLARSVGQPSPLLKAYAILYRDAKYVTDFSIYDLEKGQCVNCDDNPFEGYSHKDLTNIGTDDHHPQEHTHDGTDGSGVISHSVLAGIGEDDHHAKNHKHGEDGVDAVDLATDVVGTLSLKHLSHLYYTGDPGDLELIRNPLADDKLVKIIAPDSETYLVYDWTKDGRLEKTCSIFKGVASIETLHYGTYVNSRGIAEEAMIGTDKVIKDATDAEVLAIVASIMSPKPV